MKFDEPPLSTVRLLLILASMLGSTSSPRKNPLVPGPIATFLNPSMIYLLGGSGYVGQAYQALLTRKGIPFRNLRRAKVNYPRFRS